MVFVVPLLTVAKGRPLHLSGVGEDDGLGRGQHQDRRRVATVAVVEILRDVIPVVHLQTGDVAEGLDDLRPELVVSRINSNVGATAYYPPRNVSC